MKETPNYYAIIPANVRYDSNLTADEKLLYGEITALTHSTGKCFASNRYFADLYNVSKETISRRVAKLRKFNYITVEIVYKPNSMEIQHRYIQLSQYPHDANVNTPIDATVKDNTTSNNNTSTNIKKYTKDFNFRKAMLDFGFDEQLVSDWLKVRAKRKATNTETAFNGFINEIQKRQCNRNEVLRYIVEQGWKGFKWDWIDNAENKEELKSNFSRITEVHQSAKDGIQNIIWNE